ncbi:MAG: hypothetical protein N2037_03085 [Acidimicrobiales bacterium]|nr:hypothetical protein [Acidimicrobiales bacterium]
MTTAAHAATSQAAHTLRTPGPGALRPERAIAWRAFRQIWIGSVAWAVAFGGTIASSAITYASTFQTEESRQQLVASTAGDAGFSILLGPTDEIGTVGGYTVYKGFVFLTTIGAVWGLLVATRLLRGEEEVGRWQLTVAGVTSPARATLATMAAIGAGIMILFGGSTLATALAGRDPDVGLSGVPVILYGASLAIAPAVFASVGALTSQLARSRRLASGIGGVIIGAAFVMRMVADAGPELRWLRWSTPFGWAEEMAPFTANNARPLIPAAITVAVLTAAATALSGRRDAGDGLLTSGDSGHPRSFGLRSSLGLATRLEFGPLLGWFCGVAAAGAVLGITAKLTTRPLPESMNDLMQKLGVAGARVDQYFGIAFLLVATVVALVPASHIGAITSEETSGRLVHVLARGVTRRQWFVGRLGLGALAVTLTALVGGFSSWAAAALQGVDFGLATALGAGANVIPTALIALGIGAAVSAWFPRAGAASVYAVVVWSLVADIMGSLGSADWLQKFSLIHYMALAPAERVEPTTIAANLIVAGALCAVAVARFERRDLECR